MPKTVAEAHTFNHPDDHATVQREMGQVLTGQKQAFAFESRLINPSDQSIVWIQSLGVAENIVDGKPTRIIGLAQNITERKRRETNLAFLADVSNDLAGLTNIEETMQRLGEKIGPFFGVKQCTFAEHSDEFKTAVAAYGWHAEDAPDLKGTYRIRDFLSEELMTALLSGEPLAVCETQTDARVNAETYGALGIRSVIAVPLTRAGEWRFQISITDNKPREWRDDEVELIQEITTRVWTRLERARTEEALRVSEARLRQATATGVFLWEIDTRTLAWTVSENFAQVIGFSDKALARNAYDSIQQLVYPDDAASATAALQQVIERGQELNLDIRIRNPETGAIVWVSYTARPERDEHGATIRLVGSAQNITQRKEAEEKMRASEERYRDIVMQATVGVAQTDLTARFIFVNDSFCRMVGYSREELLGGLTIQQITHPEDLPRNLELFARLGQTGEPFELDKRYIHKDGSLVWANVNVSVIRDAQGNPLNTQAVMLDITERKRGEAVQQHLLGRLVTSQEEERRRISRDLHDQVGQLLTGLRLNLELLKKRSNGQTDSLEQIEQLEQLAARLDADLDFITWQMRPPVLDQLGLAEALKTYVKEWAAQVGINAVFHSSALKRNDLAPDLESNLFRIAQEALNNVAKHANATTADVLIEQRPNHLMLIVEDDGRGFDSNDGTENTNKGLGLTSMRERAALFGGTVEIEAKPDDGTAVYVRIPLTKPGERI